MFKVKFNSQITLFFLQSKAVSELVMWLKAPEASKWALSDFKSCSTKSVSMCSRAFTWYSSADGFDTWRLCDSIEAPERLQKKNTLQIVCCLTNSKKIKIKKGPLTIFFINGCWPNLTVFPVGWRVCSVIKAVRELKAPGGEKMSKEPLSQG